MQGSSWKVIHNLGQKGPDPVVSPLLNWVTMSSFQSKAKRKRLVLSTFIWYRCYWSLLGSHRLPATCWWLNGGDGWDGSSPIQPTDRNRYTCFISPQLEVKLLFNLPNFQNEMVNDELMSMIQCSDGRWGESASKLWRSHQTWIASELLFGYVGRHCRSAGRTGRRWCIKSTWTVNGSSTR